MPGVVAREQKRCQRYIRGGIGHRLQSIVAAKHRFIVAPETRPSQILEESSGILAFRSMASVVDLSGSVHPPTSLYPVLPSSFASTAIPKSLGIGAPDAGAP